MTEEVYTTSGVIIVDEAHHVKSNTYEWVLGHSKAVYRYGFSGTIPEGNTHAGMQTRQFLGEVIYKISNKTLIDMGVSADPQIRFIEMNHPIDYPSMHAWAVEEMNREGRRWGLVEGRQEAYKRVYRRVMQEYITHNKRRNQEIARVVLSEFPTRQTLVVIDSLEHGENIRALLEGEILGDIDFIHGDAPTRKGSLVKFREGKLRVLVSSVIIDEGIDISRIEVLVMAAGKKSRRQILQRVGRGLRRKEGENKVTIVDFYDKDGGFDSKGEYKPGYLERHSIERKTIYTNEKFEMKTVQFGGHIT
jgi:superfamily II DNA or RNA helicase